MALNLICYVHVYLCAIPNAKEDALDKAMVWLERARKVEGALDAGLMVEFGDVFTTLNRDDVALKLYREALTLEKWAVIVHRRLGYMLQHKVMPPDPKQARFHLLRNMTPELMALALARECPGKPRIALSEAEELVKDDLNTVRPHDDLLRASHDV